MWKRLVVERSEEIQEAKTIFQESDAFWNPESGFLHFKRRGENLLIDLSKMFKNIKRNQNLVQKRCYRL